MNWIEQGLAWPGRTGQEPTALGRAKHGGAVLNRSGQGLDKAGVIRTGQSSAGLGRATRAGQDSAGLGRERKHSLIGSCTLEGVAEGKRMFLVSSAPRNCNPRTHPPYISGAFLPCFRCGL